MRIIPDKDFGHRECPSCACETPANANRCPFCGYAFPHPTPGRRSLKLGAALLMLAILALLLILRFL